MKQKIVLVMFSALVIVMLCSNSNGYGGNCTGSTGSTTNCTNCHGSTTANNVVVELDSAGVSVASYVPGGSYTVKISATNATGLSLPKFGFEVALVKSANAGTSSAAFTGTWGTMPTGVTNHTSYLEHNTPLSPTSGTGANGTVYSVSVPWTAPVAGTGSIKLYGVLNAVNNNGNNDSGDKSQRATAATITEAVPAVQASVSIAITSGSNPTCSGTPVTFTATPTNGGTAPTYQWKVNGVNAGTGVTFTSSTLTSGQIVTCVMTSNLSGVTGSPATSTGITMTVTSSVTDSVHIAASATTICAGTSVTFTATPYNGGTSPTYQWKVGSTVVGTGSTYTSTTLANGNVVTCIMAPSGTCVSPATSTSNAVTMVVNPVLTDSVHISASATTICADTSVTFTATPYNGGTPTYQWKVGSTVVGTGSTYTTTTLANGNVVTCIMTPTGTCVSPATSTSNAITMVVNAVGTDSVHIAASASTICAGTSVTFTATPYNGGSNPTYQWKVGSTVVGTGSTYTTTTLANGNVVTCILTPSGSCATPATSTSNAITMVVTSSLTDSVNITTPSTSICSGTAAVFTAHPFNGGTPAYQWKVNGINAGTNSATFSTTTLVSNDIVTCVMTPSGTCVAPATSTSNAITVTVGASVTPTIHITTPSTAICPGSLASFTATETNGGTSPVYQWKINGVNTGTSNSVFSSAALANGDIITCQLTSSASCASPAVVTSNGDTMIVSANQTPTVHVTGTATICSGAADTFVAQVTLPGFSPTFSWKVNGVAAGTNSSVLILPSITAASAITCTFTSSSACASPATVTSTAFNVAVTPTVVPTISISTSSDTICAGASAAFTATVSGGGSSPSYQWFVNTTQVSALTAYSSTQLNNGDHVSCLYISNATCASPTQVTSNIIPMTVNTAPATTVTPSGPITLCSGDSLKLTASGGGSYLWSTTDTGTTIWVHTTGSYDVTASAGGCSIAAANPANVTVHTPTIPTISQSGNVATSSPAVHYQWQVNDTILGGADTTQAINITESGSYVVTIVDASGCSASSVTYALTYTATDTTHHIDTTGIIGVGADLGVKLYPIPNHGSFVVAMADYAGAQFAIYDMYGKALYEQPLTSSHQEISDADLPAALYFVRITSGRKVQTIKMQVIKE